MQQKHITWRGEVIAGRGSEREHMGQRPPPLYPNTPLYTGSADIHLTPRVGGEGGRADPISSLVCVLRATVFKRTPGILFSWHPKPPNTAFSRVGHVPQNPGTSFVLREKAPAAAGTRGKNL